MTARERPMIPLSFTGANGTNTFAQLSPIFTEIRGEVVPEPATATLSLLGLAALMMRRRRA